MSLKLLKSFDFWAQTTKNFFLCVNYYPIKKSNSTKSSKYFQNENKRTREWKKKPASSCAMAKRPQTTAWRCKTHNKSRQDRKKFSTNTHKTHQNCSNKLNLLIKENTKIFKISKSGRITSNNLEPRLGTD